MPDLSYWKSLLDEYLGTPTQQMSPPEVFRVLARHDRESASIYRSIHLKPIGLADLPIFRYGAWNRDERRSFCGFKRTYSSNLKEKLSSYGNKCFYCKCSFENGPSARGRWLSWDHMNPISRGGRNELSNLVPCCLACNQRKHFSTAEEFLAR